MKTLLAILLCPYLAAQISQYPAASGGGAPTGVAGGALTGTYPNPGLLRFTAGAGTLTGPATSGTVSQTPGANAIPQLDASGNLAIGATLPVGSLPSSLSILGDQFVGIPFTDIYGFNWPLDWVGYGFSQTGGQLDGVTQFYGSFLDFAVTGAADIPTSVIGQTVNLGTPPGFTHHVDNIVGNQSAASAYGTGSVRLMIGAEMGGVNNASNSPSGMVVGVKAEAFSYGGNTGTQAAGEFQTVSSGTVGVSIGVLVDDVTGAASNYAIKTGLGKVEFGDLLQLDAASSLDATAPTAANSTKPMQVKAGPVPTANGAIAFNTTTNNIEAGQSSGTVVVPTVSGTITNGHCLNGVVTSGKVQIGDSGSTVCGSTAFSALTSGTNTTAVMIVGAGGSLAVPTQSQNDNSTKAASTAYTDLAVANAVAGVNPAVAVQAGTTTVLPNSPTYSNGASGIGAALTAGSAATLVIDGYTPILSDRILVKNQASAFQNGVYFLSTLGTGIIPYILTRSLDFDQPSDINNTGAIPVVNGTVNAVTQWVVISKVTTVGTDAVTFTQFSANPTTLTKTIASGTASLGTSAIASGACATVVTSSATGTLSTDVISFTPNASIKAVTGYAPVTTGGLAVTQYPTADNVNFDVCNWSSISVTPGAVTLNWRVVR